MRATTIVDGRLEWREHADPEPGTSELLVRVRGAGINGADLIQVGGGYPAPPGSPPDIPGLELAARDEAEGLGDAPWPPHLGKQRGEPKRVQPSRARRPSGG